MLCLARKIQNLDRRFSYSVIISKKKKLNKRDFRVNKPFFISIIFFSQYLFSFLDSKFCHETALRFASALRQESHVEQSLEKFKFAQDFPRESQMLTNG